MSSSSENARPVVLAADDEQDLLALISFSLERKGYEVLQAADGEQALEVIRERQPDIAVLDVRMPRMSGIEVLQQIRGEHSLAATPVLLLTAAVQHEDIERGLSAGANAYMSKPFSPRELVESVGALLDGSNPSSDGN